MTQPETHTLDVPGAVLHYDVRNNDASTQPVLLLIGSPMGATGFGTLAGHFTDRTVVTYDPRGAERSKRTDGALQSTTEEHADDLHQLILALDAGPVDIFATSGGAVNALALVARHPEQVRTLVAHEPLAAQVLPDREPVMAALEGSMRPTSVRALARRWRNSSRSSAMRARSRPVSRTSPVRTPPISGSAEDDGSRDDPLLGLNMPSTPGHHHDFDALRAAPTRIVVGVGAQSANMMAGRAGIAVAGRLGTAPVTFPGGHEFVGGEYGGMGEPDAFAATLREVLTD